MELTEYLGYQCTDDGLKLVKAYPGFINSVWFNPVNREYWFKKSDKDFTKIHHNGLIYVEKTGTDFGEFYQYDRMDELLQCRGYKHIRVAKTFIGDNHKILLEYGGKMLDSKGPVIKEINEEWYDLCMTMNHMEFCIQPDGNLVVIDPHV